MSQKKAKLTSHIRNTLLEAGVPEELLRKATNQDNPKEAGGAGFNLLKKHYEYSLQEQGGVKLSSGLGFYMRGRRIHDTTTDYYRCLSDQTGDHVLQVIMRRINVGAEAPKKTAVSSVLLNEEGKREINVPAAGHDIKTGVITKKTVFIPKGTEIYFSSPNGVEGTVSFHRQAKSKETMEFKNIY